VEDYLKEIKIAMIYENINVNPMDIKVPRPTVKSTLPRKLRSGLELS
jgi:hypothetical protein